MVSRHNQRVDTFGLSLTAITVLGLVLLTLPTAALLARAWAGLDALQRPRIQDMLREALVLSLWTSLLALVVVVVVGTPIAFLLARRTFRGITIVDALVDLPIILPPAVAGIALLSAFGRKGVLGEPLDRIGISVGFSTIAVIMAQAFVSAPFFIRSARAGFLRVDKRIEEAAADLGAPPLSVLLRITLPMCLPNLIAGGILAWARALGEFGATIMFAGNRQGVTQTMPLAIYERYNAGDLPAATVLSSILLVFSVLFLVTTRVIGEAGTIRRS